LATQRFSEVTANNVVISLTNSRTLFDMLNGMVTNKDNKGKSIQLFKTEKSHIYLEIKYRLVTVSGKIYHIQDYSYIFFKSQNSLFTNGIYHIFIVHPFL